jgi:hypothetical protein
MLIDIQMEYLYIIQKLLMDLISCRLSSPSSNLRKMKYIFPCFILILSLLFAALCPVCVPFLA